jgi:hypothetical protein
MSRGKAFWIVFAITYLVAFALFSPVLLVGRVDARQTERTNHAEALTR